VTQPATAACSLDDVWRWLGDVPDPEVPVVSVVDLGIVRDVAWRDAAGGAALEVTVTPTYSGCPATAVIARDIQRALHARGIADARLRYRAARRRRFGPCVARRARHAARAGRVSALRLRRHVAHQRVRLDAV